MNTYQDFDPNDWIHLRALARELHIDHCTLRRRLMRKGAPTTLRVGHKVYINRADINSPYIQLG